jgi:hypothetical protein
MRAIAATYPGMPGQVRHVRANLRRVLGSCPIADDVILCSSELAANSGGACHNAVSALESITSSASRTE